MSDPAAPCTNCHATLPAPRPPFCPQCGQETHLRPPRVMEFLQQFGGAYLSTEGALWRTLKLLFLRPGELTARYFAGQRKHYVLPLRLYITVSVIVLLAMRLISDVRLPPDGLLPTPGERYTINLFALGPNHRVGMDSGRFVCIGLPERVCTSVRERTREEPAAMALEARGMVARFFPNLGTAMFAMPPLLALVLRVLYWRRPRHTTEHLVFALHVNAVLLLMLFVTLLESPWPLLAAAGAATTYIVMAQHRVYGGPWWALALRTGVLGAAMLAALAALTVAAGLWSLLR
jgi:hypothetical protein